ncbi:MAG: hypothetical protein AAF211_19810, partial [Myxococcota bacterium]
MLRQRGGRHLVKHLDGLELLSLRNTGLTARGAAMLSEAPGFARVRALSLSSNALGDEGVGALAAARADRLEALELELTGLTPVGLETLSRSTAFPRLRALSVASHPNLMSADTLSVLRDTPGMPALRHVAIWGFTCLQDLPVAFGPGPLIPLLTHPTLEVVTAGEWLHLIEPWSIPRPPDPPNHRPGLIWDFAINAFAQPNWIGHAFSFVRGRSAYVALDLDEDHYFTVSSKDELEERLSKRDWVTSREVGPGRRLVVIALDAGR